MAVTCENSHRIVLYLIQTDTADYTQGRETQALVRAKRLNRGPQTGVFNEEPTAIGS